MAKKTSSKTGLSNTEKVGIGVGLTAAAVAAAGAYFLYGSSDAKTNRKKVKGWMLRAKGEVLEALEKAEHMTEAEYEAILNAVGSGYSKVKDVDVKDVAAFKKEMMKHWKSLSKNLTGKKPAKKSSKKVAKKTAKKVAKKTAKKK